MSEASRKMTAARVLSVISLSLLACLIVAYLIVQSSPFRRWLQSRLTETSGYDVRIGGLSLRPPLRIAATDVAVSKSGNIIFESRRAVMSLTPLDLFHRRIYRLRLDRPLFTLDLEEMMSAPSAGPPQTIPIRNLNIRDGAVVLKTAGEKRFELRSIQMSASNLDWSERTGIAFHADVPWLHGQAEVSIRGRADGTEARVRMRRPSEEEPPRSSTPALVPENSLEMEIRLRRDDSGDLRMLASGKLHEFGIGGDKANGQFDSRLDLDEDFKNVHWSARLSARGLPSKIDSVPFPIPKGRAQATVDGSYSLSEKILLVKSFRLISPLGEASGQGKLSFGDVPTLADARVDVRRVPLETVKSMLPAPLDRWSYEGSVGADLRLDGAWKAVAITGLARSGGIELQSEELSLARLSFTAPFEWTGGSLRLRDVKVQARALNVHDGARLQAAAENLRIEGGLQFTNSELWKTSGSIALAGGSFASGDGAAAGENIALGGRFDLAGGPADRPTSLKGDLEIEKGEVLWGKFFGDLKSPKPAIVFDGRYFAAEDRVRIGGFRLSLAAMGSVVLSGTVREISRSPVLSIEARGDNLQPEGLFRYFIRDTFNRSYPVLDGLEVGGRAAVFMRASGPLDQLSADGAFQLKAGTMRPAAADWELGPIDLSLPFSLRLAKNGASPPAAGAAMGSLAVHAARLGSESIPPFKTTLSLRDNALTFAQPIRVSLYGGTVEVGGLAWRDLIRAPKAVSFAVDIKNIRLQRLTEALGWYRFGGTLTGSIPEVDWTGSALRSRGEMRLEVFGGRIRIGSMEIDNPFSSLPSIKLDARLTGIDLELASETFEFGRISGILEGSIEDLVVTNGQPSQGIADFHTVEGSGGSRWISVEALNQITVLSSGNEAGALYGGIAGFFDNFRYTKLGFKATLKNDKLTLRGIQTRDGKEYLVVGGFLPPTVNVISHTQEIGFSELLRRLERIRNSEKPAPSAK